MIERYGRLDLVKSMALGLLLACGTAQAAEWVSVSRMEGRYEEFVDTQSIRIEGPIRRASTKMVFSPHTPWGRKKDALRTHELALVAVNCKTILYRNEALAIYFEDGSNETVSPQFLNWEPISPDTTQDRMWIFLCAWKPK